MQQRKENQMIRNGEVIIGEEEKRTAAEYKIKKKK